MTDRVCTDSAIENTAGTSNTANPDTAINVADAAGIASAAGITNVAACEDPADLADKVFGPMGPRRRVLVQILRMLDRPVEVARVNEAVHELQATNRSVFEAESYCAHLQSVGAIALVAQDGTPYEDVACEPQVEVVDGQEFVRPAEKPPAFWHITPRGAAALATQDPAPRIRALLDEEPQFAHIYRTVLEMCAVEEGCQVAALEDAIDDDPAVQSPRRLATRFTDRLEQVDAIEWTDAWHCTEAGLDALATLL